MGRWFLVLALAFWSGGVAVAQPSLTRVADGAFLTPNTGQPLLLSGLYPVVDAGGVYFVGGDSAAPTNSIFRHDPANGLTTFADATSIGAADIQSFSVDAGVAAYFAGGSGVYVWEGATRTLVADTATPYPLSTLPGAFATPPAGSFSSLGVPYLRNGTVAFRGGYWGFGGGGQPNFIHEGIYTYDVGTAGPIEVVADIGTTAPGQANTFSYFATQQNAFGFDTILGADRGGPLLDEAGNLVFVGYAPGSTSGRLYAREQATGDTGFVTFYGSGRRELSLDGGVLTQSGGDVRQFLLDGTSLPNVATRNQLIPGTSTTLSFASFDVSVDDGRVLFVGTEADGRSAIYLYENGSATELVSTDDVLDGDLPRVISAFSSAFQIGREALDGDTFAFRVQVEDPDTSAIQTVVYRGDLGGAAMVGDYSGDGFVSQSDLDLVLLNWGDTALPIGFDDNASPGGSFDGLISQNELDGVLLNWGDGAPPAVHAIPEPSSAALLALGGLLLGRRRS